MKNFDFYKNLILAAAKDDIEDEAIVDPLRHIYNRFQSEKGFLVRKFNEISVMRDWFQGLAINVPFEKYEILDLAREAGLISKDAPEDEKNCFLEMYLPNLARAFLRISLDIERQAR